MQINTENPALPETLTVAIARAAVPLQNAKPEDVSTILYPVHASWVDAVQDGETVCPYAVVDAFPPLPDDIAEAADAVLDEAHEAAISAMPILLTFADANPARLLSGLRVLSFEAGRRGDAHADWRHDAEMALVAAMRLPDGPIPTRYKVLLDALEAAFDGGREAGGITDDPLRVLHPVYEARIARARDAMAERLAAAADLDALADEIADEFDIEPGDAWLAVEEISRAAAVSGDLHAARLRREQIVGVHLWFVEHADKLKERKALTVGTMVMAEQSRRALEAAA